MNKNIAKAKYVFLIIAIMLPAFMTVPSQAVGEIEADFTGNPLEGPPGTEVHFTNETSGIVEEYSWDFGDGGTSSGENPDHTYTETGLYTVTLTAVGEEGEDTATKVGYINIYWPPIDADFSGDNLSGDPPLQVYFTDTSTGVSTSWTWVFGDGGGSDNQNPSHTYTVPGSYTVSLTAENPEYSDIETKAAFVNIPPQPDFTGSPVLGVNTLDVTFMDATVGTVTTYAWDFGDTGTSSLQDPDHSYSAPGIYTVSLTVTGEGGTKTETKKSYIIVEDDLPVAADFSADPTSGDPPLEVSFTDLSTGVPTSWSWTFGDGDASTERNPTHTYQNPGTYEVELTVTDSESTDTETKTSYVNIPPQPEFTADVTSGNAPLEVTFTDQTVGTVTTYAWDFGDTGTSALQNPVHTYTTPGTYTVSLEVTGPGGSKTETKVGYVNVPPQPEFVADATFGYAPLEVTFTDQTVGTVTTYAWDFGDTGTSALQNPVHTYTTPGTYTVSLEVTGPGGSKTETKVDYITVDRKVAVADFDGDGDTDISVYRPSNGRWFIKDQGQTQWGYPNDLPVPGDYDGDGTIDIAVFRPSNGKWYIYGQGSTTWGMDGDVPVPCDYNGDGVDDIAVYRPSNGNWFIMGQSYIAWGRPWHHDIPVPGDYDGDGVCDIAVYRPGVNYDKGRWFIMGQGQIRWGHPWEDDIPVLGDYDGDGSVEPAVFRPAIGNWYIYGIGKISWGSAGDTPVPGDYDGDGTTDVGVLRTNNGKWYIEGFPGLPWYYTGDFPLPVRDTNADGDAHE